MSSSKKRSAPPITVNKDNTLLLIVLDVSPLAWGERHFRRIASDRARKDVGKGSVGPAVVEEVLAAVLAFCNAIYSLERDAGVIIVAVADNESAVVYPRKNHLAQWMQHHDSYTPDVRNLKHDLTTGVAELVARTVLTASTTDSVSPRHAAMAGAFTTALCLINRLLVAAKAGGVSALQSQHYMDRVEDQGVVALMDNNKKDTTKANRPASAWAPRVLLIQASDDRARDYNAFMNCAFAAKKYHVTVDGCFLSAANGPKDPSAPSSSPFLEQVCDLTGGIFSAPTGMAQIGGALTEVLLSVFLPPLHSRSCLNLPALNNVDFRARCFETGEMVAIAFCCNLCLSIFRVKPTAGHCPTCHANIMVETKRK
jgi:transcription initiation factor TFIIH subunit 3